MNHISTRRATGLAKQSSGFGHGFTLVELLIVIVILGILVSLIVFSYTGLIQRANIVSVTSDLSNSSKTLELYKTTYDSYPTALDANYCPNAPTVDLDLCIKASEGSSIDSYSGTADTFSLIESRGSTVSYQVTQLSSPTAYEAPASPTGPPSNAPANITYVSSNTYSMDVTDTGAPVTQFTLRISPRTCTTYTYVGTVSPAASSGNITVSTTGGGTDCEGYIGDVTLTAWFTNSYGDGPTANWSEYWD